jgi:hypothetical protein
LKLNSGIRVASIGAGGGFKRISESRGRVREKLFDTYENLNQAAGGQPSQYPPTMTVEEAI